MDRYFISSREVLAITGISRSTLNNYIKFGLVPVPDVRKCVKGHGQIRRLGYFPVWVIDRIKEIRDLKRKGLTMDKIVEKFNKITPWEAKEASTCFLAGEWVNICVLGLAIQNGDEVCRRVLPEGYVSIMNTVRKSFESTVANFGGLFIKDMMHTFLSVFFSSDEYVERTLRCAFALRQNIMSILEEWGKKIGYDIFFGIAISHGKYISLDGRNFLPSDVNCSGGIMSHVIYLSHLANNSEIFATRETIMEISPQRRNIFKYGIKKSEKGKITLFDDVFARSTETVEKSVPEIWKDELANVWVTCLVDYRYPLFDGYPLTE
ncbi:MAG: MerR family transcriptional regulator [Syntrophales bacterium]|nr:MerR family transcriptional regulator [Syntrophales bacterium]